MTSHHHAQLLREAYQAAGHGDLLPLLGLLTEDVTWADSTLGPLAGTYTKAQAPQFFAAMAKTYGGTLQLEIAGIVADDDHGIVLTRESGTAHCEPLAWTGAHVWSFDQGRCHRFAAYASAEYQRFWSGNRTAANR